MMVCKLARAGPCMSKFCDRVLEVATILVLGPTLGENLVTASDAHAPFAFVLQQI